MAERKALSKKTRFEVFKRDSFTCQYCGGKAPEIVLHVDHIKPVSKSGTNAIINLITSCVSCNLGKGARELSDDTAIKKQQDQLEQLQIRREQLDMLLSWRTGLQALKDDEYSAFNARLEEIASVSFKGDWGRKIVKKFGLQASLEAMDTAADKYYNAEVPDTVHKFVEMIPRIAAVNELTKKKPYLHDLFKLRIQVKKRLWDYPDDSEIITTMESAHVVGGMSIDQIDLILRSNHRWRDFSRTLQGLD